MSIMRAPRAQSNFYILDKTISEDRRLSWSARGLLVFLLGKPDHWEVSIKALVNETAGCIRKAGGHSKRDAVKVLVVELMEAGYVTRSDKPKHGESGFFDGYDYIVSETASAVDNCHRDTDYPAPAEPATAEPAPANPHQVSTDVLASTDKPYTPRASAKVSIILRKYGINSNPSHPVVLAMAEQGIDLEVLEACCKETREAKPGETIAVSYIAKKLEGWKSQAAQVNVAGVAKKAARETWFLSAQSMIAKARELGIPDARMGESEAAFKSRIQQAINGRSAA